MTTTGKLTFADYLALPETGLEGRAELIDGVLVELPPESGLNLDIAAFLQLALIQTGIPFQLVQVGRCEVQTRRAVGSAVSIPVVVALLKQRSGPLQFFAQRLVVGIVFAQQDKLGGAVGHANIYPLSGPDGSR